MDRRKRRGARERCGSRPGRGDNLRDEKLGLFRLHELVVFADGVGNVGLGHTHGLQ